MKRTDHDALTFDIIGCAIEVHRELGRHLLESAYRDCLILELRAKGLKAEKEVPLYLMYKGHKVRAFYADIVVNDEVILELKCVDLLLDEHTQQLLTYLEAANLERGLLINFRGRHLTSGLRRVSNFERRAEAYTEHDLIEGGVLSDD